MSVTLDYDVDEHGLVTNPGKFEREPLYVVAFYEDMLNGLDDETGPDGEAIFRLDDHDRAAWPALAGCAALVLWTTDNGFVHHRTFATLAALDAAIAADEAEHEVTCDDCDGDGGMSTVGAGMCETCGGAGTLRVDCE